MIITWDLKLIKNEIDKIARAESDPRMDGFVTWGRKQELYELYWYIEDKLEQCSEYSGESNLLEERRADKITRKMVGVK